MTAQKIKLEIIKYSVISNERYLIYNFSKNLYFNICIYIAF